MNERVHTKRIPENGDLIIDSVISTHPEFNPTFPEGGYGWTVFIISIFFQILIPSLISAFGILLTFSRIKILVPDEQNPKLWDNNLLYVPLFFIASWTFFDPTARQFICHSKWPKLFAVGGICLTCAGLLFLWIGITGYQPKWLFILSGTVSGLGSSIQMAQCEILLAQYFRTKLQILIHAGHAFSALGFILVPIFLGHHLLNESETQVILWYQALILQGLILNLFLRKPKYLKSNEIVNNNRYEYITANPDDEEDIFSKNSRELQIKLPNYSSTHYQNQQQQISTDLPLNIDNNASTANPTEAKTSWVPFEEEEEEEDDEETTKYERIKKWEKFNEKDDADSQKKTEPKKWETFETDEPKSNGTNNKNLQLELSFAGADQSEEERPTTSSITGVPIPLFSDTPVNNNTSYSYDDTLDEANQSSIISGQSSVFAPTTLTRTNHSSFSLKSILELFKEPTFYKSFLTVMVTKWSIFTYFALYPTFLHQEVENLQFRQVTNLTGTISFASLLFSGAAYWINFDRKWRPKVIWFLSWMGALGYFLISDYFNETALIVGGILINLSIAALQHVATPILGLTVKSEATKEYVLISALTGITFLFFILLNSSFKQIFRLMALLNFATGCLWLANYIYKRLR